MAYCKTWLLKLIESASLTHRPRSGSGAWRSLEKFGAVYPALYSDSGKMPAPTAGKFCNGLRSRRDVPRAGAGRVVAICCWFVSWKRCRGATLQNRTWPADKQIHMRRFLVALLIAVAAGTEDTVDQDDPTPAFAVVADGACEGWCNQCAHCGSPPAPPAKLASVRRLSVLAADTCESAACNTCETCASVAEGSFCASWCNDYTCGVGGLCTGCEACEFLFTGGGRCLPWCNSYTCGQDDCAACKGMIGSPNCLDQSTFCESWCGTANPNPS